MSREAKETAPRLRSVNIPLKTYTKELIDVLGSLTVGVSHNDQTKELSLLVVAGEGPSLLGRDWLSELKLDWSKVNHMNHTQTGCQDILDRHSALFKEELGRVQGRNARFHIKAEVQPKFYKARPVPYALRAKVETEYYKPLLVKFSHLL